MTSGDNQPWFATCPKGMESLLAQELSQLGALSVRETIAGVHFEGALATAYRACLWSRLANRILKPVARLAANDGDTLYRGLKSVNWSGLFSADRSIAIDFSGENRDIRNTRFGAQRSKDAIVDWFRDNGGRRPRVEPQRPDVRLNVRLVRDEAQVSVDFSGGSLHQRGYRSRAGGAPLKENLAAAILLRADWPGVASRGGALIDPMCGSATLLLEAALMVADIAPALGRRRFGFEGLNQHNETQWRAILADAKGRAERGRARELPEIRGYDADLKVIRKAEENIAEAGLEKVVRVARKPLAELVRPTHRPLPFGLLVCNPPYGERLGDKDSLAFLYRQLGEVMLREFHGWQAALFTSDLDLGRATGLRSHKRYALYNGAIPTHLLLFDLANNELREPHPGGGEVPRIDESTADTLSEGAQMFANRLRKNRRRLAAWVRCNQVEAYRLYDADMPEYAVAVDVYGGWVHVAEYRPPRGVDPAAAERRLEEIRKALPVALDISPEAVVFKQRKRQRGSEQYEKQGERGELISIREGQAKLLVNLHDYLDTGLFLDHRPLRLRIAGESGGKRFLNLFCYTGSATIHAALGGARSTTSVDLSNTYLGWLRKNLAHNGLDESRNKSVRANCLEWLSQEKQQFDLVLLDPPSFSNSSAMSGSFDVQRDHAELVRAAMSVLSEGGQLYFSNNLRRFKLESALGREFDCVDITASTLDQDFQRSRNVHQCWSLRHRCDR